MATKTTFIYIFSLLILLISGISAARDLISDENNEVGVVGHSYLRLPTMKSVFSSSEICEQSYGFLPCTTTVLGNMFLILVYGYLMYTAATYLSYGSELLLEILGPGIIGGLFLPILGALPDAMLIMGNFFYFYFILSKDDYFIAFLFLFIYMVLYDNSF